MSQIVKLNKTIDNREYVLYAVDAEIWWTIHSSNVMDSLIEKNELEKYVFKIFGNPHHTNIIDAQKLIKDLLVRALGFDCSALSDLLSYYEQTGKFYEKYRGHLIHQLRVYLVGICMISANEHIQEKLKAVYGSDETIIKVWTIAALTHDWGYVFEWGNPALIDHAEKSVGVLNDFLRDPIRMFYPEFDEDYFVPKQKEEILKDCSATLGSITSFSNITNWSGVKEVFKSVEEYADKTNLGSKRGESLNSYYRFLKEFSPENRDRPYYDHGIVSAYILLWLAQINSYFDHKISCKIYDDEEKARKHRTQVEETLEYAVCAACAVALHNIRHFSSEVQNKAYDEYKLTLNRFKVDFTETPLAFLLIFADSIQEWERPSYLSQFDQDFQAQDMHFLVQKSEIFLSFPSDKLAMQGTEGSRFEKIKKEIDSLLADRTRAVCLREISLIEIIKKIKSNRMMPLLKNNSTDDFIEEGNKAFQLYQVGRRFANEANFEMAIKLQSKAAEEFKENGQVSWQSRALGRVAFSSLYHGIPEKQVIEGLEKASNLDKWQGTGNYYWIVDHCLKSDTSKDTKCHFFSKLLDGLSDLGCINLPLYYVKNDEDERYRIFRSALVLFFDQLIKREHDAQWPTWAMSDQPRLFLLRAEADPISCIRYLTLAEKSFNQMELTSYGAWTKCKKNLLEIKPYTYDSLIFPDDVVNTINELQSILLNGRNILQSPRKERDVIQFFLTVVEVYYILLRSTNSLADSIGDCDFLIKGIKASDINERSKYVQVFSDLKETVLSETDQKKTARKILSSLDSNKRELAWIEANKIKDLIRIHRLERR